MEQTPVSLREPLQEFAHLEVIARHGADQGDQFFANIFSHGFLVYLESEMITALGGIFVKRALEEIQRLVDLALELFLAKLEEFGLFAHKYAYIYAYFKAAKSAGQARKLRNSTKTGP